MYKKEINTSIIDDNGIIKLSNKPNLITKKLNGTITERITQAKPLNVKYESRE